MDATMGGSSAIPKTWTKLQAAGLHSHAIKTRGTHWKGQSQRRANGGSGETS